MAVPSPLSKFQVQFCVGLPPLSPEEVGKVTSAMVAKNRIKSFTMWRDKIDVTLVVPPGDVTISQLESFRDDVVRSMRDAVPDAHWRTRTAARNAERDREFVKWSRSAMKRARAEVWNSQREERERPFGRAANQRHQRRAVSVLAEVLAIQEMARPPRWWAE